MSHDPTATPGPMTATIAALRAQAARQRIQVEGAQSAAQRADALAALAATRDSIRATLGSIQPADLFAGVDAHVPLALLPVRLETRFADPGAASNVLHVRIFPDDVHANSHDEALTAAETGLGAALWSAPADLLAAGETPPATPPPAASPSGRRALWAALVRQLGGPRAAYVAHATRPGSTPKPEKPQAYVRPPVASCLPDRWLVRAYAGASVAGEAWTSPVGVDLHLAPDPQAAGGEATAPAGLPPVDPELRWLVDYASAVAAGMAVDVPLPPATTAVDRVVAVGVRASTSPADAADALSGLLTAHRYTDGFGFLPTGSPTSSTPAAPSAYDRSADPDALWAQEFGPAPPDGTAAPMLVAALGLPEHALDGPDSTAAADDAHARAMQTALWAATWGYYLSDLIDDTALGSANLDALRSHYLAHVRGRGTLPVVRLGRQPYGVLPLLALGGWQADGASASVDGLARLLQRIRPLWRYGVAAPVTASQGPGFDAAFSRVMSQDGAARGYAIRSSLADRGFDSAPFTGIDTAGGTGVIDAIVGQLLTGGTNPLLLSVFSPSAQPVRAPLVVDPRDPMPDATVRAAIRGLAGTSPLHVLSDAIWLRPSATGPATVLHTLLRRSLLLEYAAAGDNIATGPVLTMGTAAGPAAARAATPVSMLIGLSPDPAGGFTPVVTQPQRLGTAVPHVTGTTAVGDWLWQNPAQHPDLRRTLDETLAAFGALGTLTAAELELLLRETLDLATHRWTAWGESIAADKLARLRQATPAGIALGGWGLVEQVSRRPRTSVDPGLSLGAAIAPLWQDTKAGGFVHAPSTAQAATAAVLRAAHLAHGGDSDPACAVNLSSAPARTALHLAGGIRSGQELGALLGYELERDLHERSADVLVAPLRAYAPRWKASGTFVEGDAEAIVSPSAVADGLALADDDPAKVAQAVLPPGAPAGLASALAAALAALQDHRHALADLLTAEAMHQTLLGNTSRAGAALDAAGRGGPPPEDFDVLRTPRSGASLTSRVAVLLAPAAGGALPGGWPASPRGTADPDCAAWLAALLPPVSRIRVRVADATGAKRVMALPPAAALGPLDVVLDRPDAVRTRILLQLPAGSTLAAGRDPAWTPDTVGLEELLAAAAGLRELLAARPLRRADLLAPAADGADERDAKNLRDRVSATQARVQAVSQAVSAALPPLEAAGSAAPAALTAARSAVASAFAVGATLHLANPWAEADLADALRGAAAELGPRLAAGASAADATADDLAAALKALLGANQPALPRLVLDAAAAAAATAGLAAGDRFLAAAPDLAADWLDDVGAVRAAAGRLAAALQDCDALTAGRGLPGALRIIEAGEPGAAWSAAAGAAALATMTPALTIVAWAPAAIGLTAGTEFSGMLVDEWVEVVPDAVAPTSVAYQAEAPPARAPQAILLGLAPNVSAGWNVEAVVDLVLEAAELAALREVDLENGAWLGRLLPAVLLPDGDAKDVIAASPLPLLQVDAALLAAQRSQAKELG
jgi:hypothetical protein